MDQGYEETDLEATLESALSHWAHHPGVSDCRAPVNYLVHV
jgi:hypothetical protein